MFSHNSQNFYRNVFLTESLPSIRAINTSVILPVGTNFYVWFSVRFQAEKGILQQNGDFAQGYYFDTKSVAMTPSVVFNAKGLEVFGKYKLQKMAFLAGYNLYIPNTKEISTLSGQYPLDSGFQKNDLIAGGHIYQPVRFVQIYSEQRVSFGKNILGNKEQSVFTIE